MRVAFGWILLTALASPGCQPGTMDDKASSAEVKAAAYRQLAAGAAADRSLEQHAATTPAGEDALVVPSANAQIESPAPNAPSEVAAVSEDRPRLGEAVAAAPVATPTTAVAPPLPVAFSIGPPKKMDPPTIPFTLAPRTVAPKSEWLGKRELYKPANPATEFAPKRLLQETVIPFVSRPVLDEPELSRGEASRPALPMFPYGLKARKPAPNPSQPPPLSALSLPTQEKLTPASDPGDRYTRGATTPVAQPTRPEKSPSEPRLVDPQENVRAFRVTAPLPETDAPASAEPAKPILPATKP